MLEHGGRLLKAVRQYGIAREAWLDLSSGIAPWAYPVPPIPAHAWARLPETEDGLEEAARQYYGVGQLLPVAGSQAAIQALPHLRPSGRVGVLSPCYAEHPQAWQRAGHQLVELDESQVEAYLDSLDVLVLVNPNNPTGHRVPPNRLLAWHARLAERGGWLVVDEAFMDNTPEHSVVGCADRPGLIVLRSFGKFFGLAGLRLGFIVAATPLVATIRGLIGEWPVSSDALAAGLAAYANVRWMERERGILQKAAQRLDGLLTLSGFELAGGTSLFRLARAADAHERFARLLTAGILVRPFDFAPDLLRFGLPRGREQWRRLAAALGTRA
jgi:cobalamin biosynthetic protein CobC